MAVTFRTKLLASHVGLVVVVVAILVAFLDRSLAADLERQLDQRLEQQARGAAQWGANEGRRHPEKVASRLAVVLSDEVTIFDGHGTVLGDSVGVQARTPTFADGASRGEAALQEPPGAEVASAMKDGVGRATRVRPSGEEMHYVAVATGDGWVVRLAAPLSDINATLAATRRRIAFGTALAILVAMALGLLASRVASGPLRAMTAAAERIAGGDFEIEQESASPDEFGALSRSLASLARQLEARIGELSAARDMRRDFMANASHELRTPVTAIQGYAETLLRGSADAETSRHFLEVIHRHARRLAALVDDLLKLAELEDRPKERVVHELVDVSGVAAAAAATVRGRATNSGMSIEVEVPEDLRIHGDPIGLEQVLENLLDNAVKYGGRDGGGMVRVRGSRDAKSGAVRVAVEDEGQGIEAQHLPRLFERFYRVDPGRSRERGGTGLGLSIVKQLVESMGGRVDVTSTVGAGTTFVLQFEQMV